MKHLNSLKVRWDGNDVGTLAMTDHGVCAFEYAKNFLISGHSISPFELPLKEGVFMARPEPFYGGFGVFDDSLPDGWGLLVQNRYLQQKGIPPFSLNLLDRLALVGSGGRGALEFFPDNSIDSITKFSDFTKLSKEAEIILHNNDYFGEGIVEFQKKGGSPGGARPKVSVNFEGKEWFVKFRALEDPENIGHLEYQYSLLAKKCGIEMPKTRLFEEKYFGVERFDRKVGRKVHTVSVAGLIRADYRLPSIDYHHIFKVASILCRDIMELWKIFRLMVFNYIIGNKDDHAKNFAFIYDEVKWHFAPAFDLLPSSGINGYRTTSINDSITPQKKDLIALAEIVGLPRKEAEIEYDRIEDIISTNPVSW